MKKLIGLFVMLTTLQVNAQLEQAKQIMQKLYSNYESANSMSFSVNYYYTTDSVNEIHKNDTLTGRYTMSGRKAKFQMGEMEYSQNDNYFICVYNDSKTVIVDKPKIKNNSSSLPIRQLMDSMMQMYSSHYNVEINEDKDNTSIVFIKKDEKAKFLKFSIVIDKRLNLLSYINYEFIEQGIQYASEGTDEFSNVKNDVDRISVRKRNLKVVFSDYTFEQLSKDFFNESQYISMDEKGYCKPVGKFETYTIFNNIIKNIK